MLVHNSGDNYVPLGSFLPPGNVSVALKCPASVPSVELDSTESIHKDKAWRDPPGLLLAQESPGESPAVAQPDAKPRPGPGRLLSGSGERNEPFSLKPKSSEGQ